MWVLLTVPVVLYIIVLEYLVQPAEARRAVHWITSTREYYSGKGRASLWSQDAAGAAKVNARKRDNGRDAKSITYCT